MDHKRMLRNQKHHCTHLQSAWLKYGESAFEFSMLEECDPSVLIEKEQSYFPPEKTIGALKSNGFYNQSPLADRPIFEGWNPSDEVRQKLSEENRKRWRDPEYRRRMTEKAREQWKVHMDEMRAGGIAYKHRLVIDSGQLPLFADDDE